MPSKPAFTVLWALITLAGCASQAPSTSGRYLVYRDAGGAPSMQIDYPTEAFCRKVEAIASRNARCQAQSAQAQLHARASLRYSPPGMLVEGHYADLASCQTANSRTAPGVELVTPCSVEQGR